MSEQNAESNLPRASTIDDGDPPVRESVLVTGFPAFAAQQMTRTILGADPQAKLTLLVATEAAAEEQANAFLSTFPAEQAARLGFVYGEVSAMDLGLAGVEYRSLADEITAIHHLAGLQDLSASPDTARVINIEGTRHVMELASDCRRLRRVCHWSAAVVSGKRDGVILEEELDEGQSFHNEYEHSKFEAEKLARAAQRRLPVTILRPGIIVGDSQTGEIDKLDGPYYLMVLIANNATQVNLPLPGRGTAPLHLVPIDYVVKAAYALSMDEQAAGKTFHLTDPNPLSARRIYELVAEHSHTKPPRGFIPGGLTRTLLRAPGLERLARAPRAFVDSFDHQVFYNSRQTCALLAGTGIQCPSFDTYADHLVRYVLRVQETRRHPEGADDDVVDPFD